MAKDIGGLVQELEERGCRVHNPPSVSDSRSHYLLVNAEQGRARWCTRDLPLSKAIKAGETAYTCPLDIWCELAMALP